MTTVIEVCSLAGCASDCDEQGMLLEISLLSMWKLSIRPLESIFTYGVACGAIRSINGSGKNLRDEGGLVFTFCYLWFAEILWILLLLVCRNFVTWRDGEDWCQDFDTSFVPKFCRILYFWCAKIL